MKNIEIDKFFYSKEDLRENLELNLQELYTTSKDVSIVNILNTIGENNTTENKDEDTNRYNIEKDNVVINNTPDNSNLKNNISSNNKYSRPLNSNLNNQNFSIGNSSNSQNNFNNLKVKEVNTPKNHHLNRILLVDSTKDIKSKIEKI